MHVGLSRVYDNIPPDPMKSTPKKHLTNPKDTPKKKKENIYREKTHSKKNESGRCNGMLNVCLKAMFGFSTNVKDSGQWERVGKCKHDKVMYRCLAA